MRIERSWKQTIVRHPLSFAVAALYLVVLVAAAQAGEPGYYAGGKFHSLTVSADEWAAEFAEPQDRAAASARLRTTGEAAFEDMPWGETHGRFALLRMPPAAKSRMRAMPGVVALHRVYRTREGGLPIIGSGQIVVKLRHGLSDEQRQALWHDYAVEEIGSVDGLARTYVVRPLGDAAARELDTANALYVDDRTVYAHADLRFPVETRQFFTDTFYSRQWYLENLGQQGAKVGEDINLIDSRLRTSGAGILIGMLDDACDVAHEDLVSNYSGISHNAANNTQSATAANPVNPGDRHGTATMGIMVARQNGQGVVGIAPLSQFTVSRGVQAFLTTSQVASAYSFARNRGVDVHNNSWGLAEGTPVPDVLRDALSTAFYEGRNGLGMVLVFASGRGQGIEADAPTGVEVDADEELATLPVVIGVGASTPLGELAPYSNYGRTIDVLAPSNDFSNPDLDLPAIVTTDNTDAVFGNIEPGYNNSGFSDDGSPNLANPNYTDNFGGTSAAAAQVSALAALILSLEPAYTATMVRNIIEHTAEKINPLNANYNGITGRSLRYGYGRIDAGAAVEATYDGFFWPERLADVCLGENCNPPVPANTIRWKINDDLRIVENVSTNGVKTISVLVVESDRPFSWAPTDGQEYSVGMQVANGVIVRANLLAEMFTFTQGAGTKYFGLYPVATTPRRGLTYGFGVAVDSLGTVIDSGTFLEPPDVVIPPENQRPRVTISVSPLAGESPLTVTFTGNAESVNPIESFLWDFGDGTTSSQRNTTHVYTVAAGTQRFFPVLTAIDVLGNSGSRSVAIDVSAPGQSGGGEQTATVRIRISAPGSPQSDIAAGQAPLPVVLNAEITGLATTPPGLTVAWDLGDGNTANGLSVAHTYRVPGTFPITVSVNLNDEDDTVLQTTRFVQVLAGTASPSPTATPSQTPDPNGNGGIGCGAGAIVAIWAMAMMALARRCMR